MDKKFAIIIVSCATANEGRRIADLLLKKRLVACANIISGVESRFWWKGKLDKAREAVLTMKTVSANFQKIEKEVRRLHSYEVPEIILLPIGRASKSYLEWINKETGP